MYRIKELRIQKDMTQEMLAQKAGISRQSLSAIENGKQEPKTRTLTKIARALGYKYPWHLFKKR